MNKYSNYIALFVQKLQWCKVYACQRGWVELSRVLPHLVNSLSQNDPLYFRLLGRVFTYCTAQLEIGHSAATWTFCGCRQLGCVTNTVC